MPDRVKVAFITNFCPHYRIRTFEGLALRCDVKFYFYSSGGEWYWQQQHGTRAGNFSYEYLSGFSIAGTRVNPRLAFQLWREDCEAFVKCINGRFVLPVTYLIARLRRKPFVLWTGVWMRLRTPVHRLIFPLTRYIYRRSDAIVVYGEHVRRFLISEGVMPEKIFVAPHAIDNAFYARPVSRTELVHLRKSLDIQPHQRAILYLGRLEPSKGVQYLLTAFSQMHASDTILIVAGDGACKNDLIRQVNELSLSDRVRFAGYVPPENALAYYALAYAFVLPSVTTASGKEPWGLVVNEAMNQGCPVIATEAVGAAAGGLLRDGQNGLVVPERDSLALAAALERLLNDLPLRKRLSERSMADVNRWNNENMVFGFTKAIEYVVRAADR